MNREKFEAACGRIGAKLEAGESPTKDDLIFMGAFFKLILELHDDLITEDQFLDEMVRVIPED